MNEDIEFSKLTSFLEKLSRMRIIFNLAYCRENSLMVTVPAPGEIWEVEFFTNGDIEVERYRSNGEIEDEQVLNELFDKFSGEEK